MCFFWSSLFEMGRNVRMGTFDFFLAQPGNVMFMVSTRKLDPDGLVNTVVAAAVVIYAAGKLDLHPGAMDLFLYVLMIGAGVVIHYSMMAISMSLVFWLTSTQGVEGAYFALTEFSRLPKAAFKGVVTRVVFVWALPVVVVSNAPASTILHGFSGTWVLWLIGIAAVWFGLAVVIFNAGLRRYTSASS
jgi:ABC-2 type transport system permease protein